MYSVKLIVDTPIIRIHDEKFGKIWWVATDSIANIHYCPGKLCKIIVQHQKLKNLPMLLRYSIVHALYSCYCRSLKNQQTMKPIEIKSFQTVVGALRWRGTFNWGLSYYYVDHIDIVNRIKKVVSRLLYLVECLDQCDQVLKACNIIEKLNRQTELASKYLCHKLYAGIQEENKNAYSSAK